MVRVSKCRPLDQVPSNSADEQREVGHESLRSAGLEKKIDTKVSILGGIETRFGETDGVEG